MTSSQVPVAKAALFAAGLLLALIPIVLEAGPLAALPLLALVLPLLAGRFPGEAVIVRIASRGRRPRRPLASAPRPRTRQAPALLRTRLLIAASLAGRPPPAAASI
jgi:hypothetical protein